MTELADYGSEPEVTLGWRLQIALQKGQLKQQDLMSAFEVSRETVSRWCRDLGKPPKKHVLKEIALMCGVSPQWLIDGTTTPAPPNGGGAPSAPIPGDESLLPGLNRGQIAYLVARRPAPTAPLRRVA